MKLIHLFNKIKMILYPSSEFLQPVQQSYRVSNVSKEKKKEFDNTYNLTGCLTVIDSLLNKVNISGENFNCEDTINFIRSFGSLNNIQIKNSKSDSLDADFSQLKFVKVVSFKKSENK